MLRIRVKEQEYQIMAAGPATVAAVELMLKHAGPDPTGTTAPAGQYLIYVFGTTESRDAGPLVLQTLDDSAKTLDIVAEIHREIVLVRNEHQALRTAKARLEQMQAEKLFAFTDKIDAQSFRILCAVLAQGDVAKASRSLNMKDATLRSRMKSWAERGPAYQVLTELVRWRKAMGAKGTVPLNEAIVKETAVTADFAGLLSDVLDELLTMNEENWGEKAEALAELLRPHVAR